MADTETTALYPGGSARRDRKFLFVVAGPSALLLAALVFAIVLAVANTQSVPEPDERVRRVLSEVPLIDGHNDLPYAIRKLLNNNLNSADLSGATGPVPGLHTDMARMRKGMMGGVFWSCYSACSTQYKDAVRVALEQIDLIKRLVRKYNTTLQLATSADQVWQAFNQSRVASLIGMESGHMLDSSLGALRTFYDVGVRYVTLTHSCSTPWADTSVVDNADYVGPRVGGLNEFGTKMVLEMNRLGMFVDLSHTSKLTQLDVLNVTRAPVLYSHSSAFALCNNSRNVHDDVIQLVKQNRGLIMVNSFPSFVSCSSNATIQQVAQHADYIKRTCGPDCVGIGADFDGIEEVSVGFEDVSKYPDLLKELINLGWTDDELRKFAGLNLLRLLSEVEKVRDQLSNWLPDESAIPKADITNTSSCRTDW